MAAWDGKGERASVGISLPDQVRKFRYLIDIEGAGYSGRLKMLMHSGRVVFVQDRPWREWFFDLMHPWEHYVPVARDLSDLLSNLEVLRKGPELENRIARAGAAFADRHLTRAAAVRKWRELLGAPRP